MSCYTRAPPDGEPIGFRTMEERADHPGGSIGLPASGPGSLAAWMPRVGGLMLDWFSSMVVAVLLFGQEVLVGSGWQAWMTLAVYFVQASIMTTVFGSSFGQLITRVGVTTLDRTPLGLWKPTVRTLLKCLVIPMIVVGAERRPLYDLLLGTVVVNRR